MSFSQERNANPRAAALRFSPPSSSGASASLRARFGLPPFLPGGWRASLTDAGLAVVDPGGEVVLRTRVHQASIQTDPEGRLLYSDGYSVTRWDPLTRQTSTFAYSFPEHYGHERFDGMVALPDGQTLIIGTAGQVRPHLLSLHLPDGRPRHQVDLANATIDDVFVSRDRRRVYLSCHHLVGDCFGHAVHRLDITGGPRLERLTFHLTQSLYQHRAVVLEDEDILLFQGTLVQRCSRQGEVRHLYDRSLDPTLTVEGEPLCPTLDRVPVAGSAAAW